MSASELMARIVEIGRSLSAAGVTALAQAVRTSGHAERFATTADGLNTPAQQKAAARLAAVWTDVDTPADQLAMALEVAQLAAEQERSVESVELVWTGPKSPDVAVAMNAEALHEIIDGATESLLVVSAYTWAVPQVVARLAEAAQRGVAITMVLEWHDGHGQPTGFDPVRGLGGELPDAVAVYEWPVDLRPTQPDTERVGYLHAKCAVADRRHAFVSSANLTVYAMEANMELGLVVRGGPIPARIADHFAALIGDGVLRRVEAGQS